MAGRRATVESVVDRWVTISLAYCGYVSHFFEPTEWLTVVQNHIHPDMTAANLLISNDGTQNRTWHCPIHIISAPFLVF